VCQRLSTESTGTVGVSIIEIGTRRASLIPARTKGFTGLFCSRVASTVVRLWHDATDGIAIGSAGTTHPRPFGVNRGLRIQHRRRVLRQQVCRSNKVNRARRGVARRALSLRLTWPHVRTATPGPSAALDLVRGWRSGARRAMCAPLGRTRALLLATGLEDQLGWILDLVGDSQWRCSAASGSGSSADAARVGDRVVILTS